MSAFDSNERKELELLLHMIDVAAAQVDRLDSPDFSEIFTKARLSVAQKNLLIERWQALARAARAEIMSADPLTVRIRDKALDEGSMRLLFAAFVRNFRRRLIPESEPASLKTPPNERKSRILLTPPELESILAAMLDSPRG